MEDGSLRLLPLRQLHLMVQGVRCSYPAHRHTAVYLSMISVLDILSYLMVPCMHYVM